MVDSVRTRFAPSPTGTLHIGSVRTALFCWLYARRHGGQFVLRVEDTDRARSTEESVRVILEALEWLRLEPDEGPFFQTSRFDRYREVAAEMIADGRAYHCYCTPEELAEMREQRTARGREAALRRSMSNPQCAAQRRCTCGALPQPRRRPSGRRGPSARPGRFREQRARRSHNPPVGHHADVSLQCRGGRRGHAHQPCHSRRRPSEQYAPAHQSIPRARRTRAALRTPTHDRRTRRSKALEAAWCSERARVSRAGLPPGRPAELPRAARMGARRPGAVQPRRDGGAVRFVGRAALACAIRRRKAWIGSISSI